MRLALLPSGLTLWLLAAASPLFLVSAPLALAVDASILLLALVDGGRALAPSARREAPRVASLGATVEVRVTVANPAPREVVVLATDDLDPCLRRAAASDGSDWNRGARLTLAARGSARLSYSVTPRARGLLSLGAIHLRALSPLGLAWRRSTVDAEDELLVQPGVRDLSRERGHSLRHGLRAPGPRRSRRWGEGREFESMREYVRGDDPRAIDWKASARRRKYLVRDYEAERSQHVVLAIDAGRMMRERVPGGRERIDYALGACTMLASRARRFGDRLGVLVFDDRVRHLSPPRRADPPTLARVLAGVETRLVESNYPLAFATLGRTFRKRSLVVLFCDVVDGTVSRALANSLQRVGRAHLPLAVAIRNPELERAAGQPVRDDGDAYRRAAAEELVQARANALRAMRQAGILVVDTPPGDALARTLDKYVEIKERGLL